MVTASYQTYLKHLLRNKSDEDMHKYIDGLVCAFNSQMIEIDEIEHVLSLLLDSAKTKLQTSGRTLVEKIGTSGSAYTTYLLAIANLNGTGGDRCESKGMEYLEIALTKSPERQLRGRILSLLADSYRIGRGVQADGQKALTLYCEAAKRGDDHAAWYMGMHLLGMDCGLPAPVEEDPARARDYYKQGAFRHKGCANGLEMLDHFEALKKSLTTAGDTIHPGMMLLNSIPDDVPTVLVS